MRNTITKLMLALLIGACLALVGCESDNDNGNGDTPSSVNLSGNWRGRINMNGEVFSRGNFAITHSGSSISGTWLADGNSPRSDTATLSGTASGGVINATVIGPAGSNWVATGNGTYTQSSITMVWSDSYGDSGGWMMARI